MSELVEKSPAESADYTPINTATMAGKAQILGAALGATLKGIPALLPLVLLVGGLGHLVMSWGGALMVDILKPTGQGVLWTSELTKQGVAILWFILAKPLIDASAIYVWRKVRRGQDFSTGQVLNWAIGRYKRMLKPHAAKFLTVSLGLIIVVPGVLFGLQYAFVHAIAATEDDPKSVLSKSQRFTQGRRGRIAAVWVPYALLWYPAYSVIATYQVEAWGWYAVAGFGALDMLFLTIMTMVLYGMYEERVHDARIAKARRDAKKSDAEA